LLQRHFIDCCGLHAQVPAVTDHMFLSLLFLKPFLKSRENARKDFNVFTGAMNIASMNLLVFSKYIFEVIL
jgi:hypothetical protein